MKDIKDIKLLCFYNYRLQKKKIEYFNFPNNFVYHSDINKILYERKNFYTIINKINDRYILNSKNEYI